MTRLFDIILSLIGLIALSPILIPVIVILRLTGEHEVFYRQTRVGQQGKHFKLWKFATMLKDSPNIGSGVLTLKNDPRVLPFGDFLRRTKINELPQLINVLSGEMSLIGPRPQAIKIFELFPAKIQDILKTVPPGLSGIGSIIFRDEETIVDQADDRVTFYAKTVAPYKGKIECWFASNRGLMLYFSLIFLTLWVIVKPRSTLPWRMLTGLPKPTSPTLRKAMHVEPH